MKKSRKIVLLTLSAILVTFLSPSPRLLAKTEIAAVNIKRAIEIRGPIDAPAIGTANRLLTYAETSKDPVWIVIDSPGGDVLAGLQVISIMNMVQARGVKIHCVVPMMAASMAFQIFSECDVRYSLQYSLLLWHPIRASSMAPITPKMARQLAEDMERYEGIMVETLMAKLKIPEAVFFHHYHNETLHLGLNLKELAPHFLTIVKDIRGVKNPISMREQEYGE